MIKLSTSDQFKLCGAIGIVGSSAKNLKYIVWLLGQLEGNSRSRSERLMQTSTKSRLLTRRCLWRNCRRRQR